MGPPVIELDVVWMDTEEEEKSKPTKQIWLFSSLLLVIIDNPLPWVKFDLHYTNESLFTCQVPGYRLSGVF